MTQGLLIYLSPFPSLISIFGGEFQYQSKKFVKISIRRLLKIWFSLGVYIKVVPKIIPLFKTFAVFLISKLYL